MHRSRVRGAAPEFSEYRAFRQGDDPRRLDWKLLGRTDRVFLRLADDRAIVGTVLVVDGSASMDFPAGRQSKWHVASRFAIALAQVAHQSGDPVGLIIAGDDGPLVPPRTRRGVVSEIASALDRTMPRGRSTLSTCLTRTELPSRVVLLSDFLDDDPDVLRAATAHQARGGEVLALEVIARGELEPSTSPFTAVDPEDAAIARPFAPAAAADYRGRFAEWRSATARRWRAAGARWIEIVTDEPVARAARRVVAPGMAP